MAGKADQILNSMIGFLPLWLWLFIPAVFACATLLILGLIESLWKKRVRESSEEYRWLMAFNQNWHFQKIKKVFIFKETVKTRAELKKYDFQQAFSEVVNRNAEMLWDNIQRADSNRDLLIQYKTALQQEAVKTTERAIKKSKVPKSVYSKYEKQLCQKHELSPQTGFLVRIIVEKGGNGASKKQYSAVFDSEDIKKELSGLWDDKVREHSTKLQRLLRLNQLKAGITETISPIYYYEIKCANVNEFRKYTNSNQYMKRIITENYDEFLDRLRKAGVNKAAETAYVERYTQIKPTSAVEINGTGVPESYFYQCEDKLFDACKLNAPLTSFECETHITYVSPKGRNYSQDHQHYSFYMIRDLIEEVTRDKARREMYYQSKEFERSKMTNSLRYDVMKRDGFKCTICGASSKDGVKLHVDHIKPVSKGGKTEMENLRTLCDRCNSGKRDKYDPNGIN